MNNDGVWNFSFGILIMFIFAGNLTLINMVIGVMCEVANDFFALENEKEQIQHLKTRFGSVLQAYDIDDSKSLTRDEFRNLQQDPEFHSSLVELDVDVVAMFQMTE